MDERDFLKKTIDSMRNENKVHVSYFSEYLNLDNVVEKIRDSEFYKNFILGFTDKEPMSPSVYSVVREEAWNIDALDEIEMQFELLNPYERFMFHILKCGTRISKFYFNGGLSWYYTFIESNFSRRIYGGEEFERYLEPSNRFNQPCENVFISVIAMYDEPLFLEHNEPLTYDIIQTIKKIEFQGIQEFRELSKAMSDS